MTNADTYLVRASFAQQRMWFLEQLEDGAPTYNTQLGLRFTGTLDRDLLNRAVAGLVRRHEALRTTFDGAEDELLQVIDTVVPDDLVTHADLSGRPDPERALAEVIDTELRRPFDLARGPVLRAGLHRVRADEHVLLLTLDHVTCDGWSMGILHNDLVRLYTAGLLGAEPPTDPDVQYADFAVWQRDWLQGDELDRQLEFWRTRLADPPPVVVFPATSADHRAERDVGTAVQPLPRPLLDTLAELGQRHNSSLFAVLTAAFATLFTRYTGQRDLVLGTVVANRNQAEVAEVVGLFANTVALRLDLSGEPTVAQLITRTRDAVLDAQTHQHVPFDQVVAALAPDRAAGRVPYFNVIVEHTDIARDPADLGAVRIDPMPLATLPIPVELVVNLRREGGELAAIWHHDSTALTTAAVEVMQEQFRHLLDAIATDPAGPVADLPLGATAPVHDSDVATAREWGCPGDNVQVVDHLDRPSAVGVPGELTVDGRRTGILVRRRVDGTLDRLGADADETTVTARRAEVADAALLDLVADVWRQVLGTADVAADDDFFDLGGHSLAASRVISRLRKQLDVEVRTRLLFDNPVLGEFVGAITGLGATPKQR